MMNTTSLNWGKIALAVASLSTVFGVTARADCGIPTRRLSSSRLAAANMPVRANFGQEQALPDSAATANPRSEFGYSPSITGLWMTTFTSGGEVADQGFDLWNNDGTEVLNDDPAPSTGNVCLGVYVKTGLATYKLKHPSWTFDNNGNLTGTAIIRETVTVAPGGNSYAGTFTVDIFDLANNPLAHFDGTIAAQRITVDF